LDATTIDLFLSLFLWAPFSKAKGAVKLHTLLNLKVAIPAFIHISNGKMHEVNAMFFLPTEARAFYVMDRGYLDFTRLYRLHQIVRFFVTRAKANTNARRIYSSLVDRATGLVFDQTIALNGFYATQHYPGYLKRIRFNDAQSVKTLILLTNNLTLPPLTFAALYKNCWQVELFFKWIKQHLRIRSSWATPRTQSRRKFGAPR
jgi:hypothetical protein